MDKLSKDVLFNIATMLDLDELLSFCSSDSRVNRLVCQDRTIWLFKLIKEFPEWKQLNMEPRQSYELLISLNKLKKEFKYEGSIYELYKETKLDLSYIQITILPPEIGNLINLRILYLHHNQIKTVPPEIGKLSQLQELWLNNNQIKILPPEIGNLSQLQILWLYNNQIEILPPEIGNLSKLRELSLHDNKIEILPSEIGNLRQLDKLYLDREVLIPDDLKLPIIYW